MKIKLITILLVSTCLSSCGIVDSVREKTGQVIQTGKDKLTAIKAGITTAQERLQAKINQVNKLVEQVQETKTALQKLVGESGGNTTDQAKISELEAKLKKLEAAQDTAKTEVETANAETK